MIQVGQTISKEEFGELPDIGETISQEQFNQLPDAEPEKVTAPVSVLQRLRLGFGGKEAEAERQRLETASEQAGNVDILGDIADVAGDILPLIGGIAGGVGGAIGGVGVGGIGGAVVGTVAGETTKQAIGRMMGVREQQTLPEEVKEAAVSGAYTYIGGKVLSKIGGAIAARYPKLLSIFTGESAQAVSAALKNPAIADQAIQQGDEMLRGAIQVASKQSQQVRGAFLSGYKNVIDQLSKAANTARVKIDQTKIISDFVDLLENKGVLLTKDGLEFFGSKIKVNPGEVGKINEAFETVMRWNDWSVGGANTLKQIVGGLTKFADVAGRSSKSPALGQLYHVIDETIEKSLPKALQEAYKRVNAKFGNTIGMMDDMVDVFNQGDPFKRLAGLFSENADTLRQIIDFYEKQTGKAIAPIIAGRALGAERQAAFGLLNPRSWIDFFIPPQTQAQVVTLSGKVGKSFLGTFLKKAAPGISTNIANQLQKLMRQK